MNALSLDVAKKILSRTLFQQKSRCRRLQYEWLKTWKSSVGAEARALDLGGVKNAEYLQLLGLRTENVTVWNASAKTSPDALVDLDDVASLPAFPAGCDVVLILNLLEHLYRPLELLGWAAKNLPAGGKLIISTPFCYPIHPSPNDYWRITPQTYERFFSELAKREGLKGDLSIMPLAEDYRDGISLFTTPMFFGDRVSRLAGSVIESTFWAGSLLTAPFLGEKIKTWAEHNPLAIGLIWKKS